MDNETIIRILTEKLEQASKSQLRPITLVSPPNDVSVLLYWEKSGHMEDGKILREKGHIHHYLFDGECLNDQPTHFMELPTVES